MRGLATDPDAGVRRAAYDAELAAWETVEVPLAAALNAFKGEANVLNRRRGWADSLDVALLNNNVDRATLEAMQEAVVASLADFARYLRAKATLLGHPSGALPWWDLLAPVGVRPAVRVVRGHRRGAPRRSAPTRRGLAGLVGRAVDDGWLDAEPRAGKVGGAFCMSVQGEVSRVLLNFDGSFDSVQTLAHELGHAYHNTNLGAPHAAAAPDADGAGRDGEHLLRDDHGPGRAGRGRRRRRRAARDPRRRPRRAPPRWWSTSTPGSCSSGR